MNIHPNVHAAWSDWSAEQTLHVVVPYVNPLRYRTRRQITHDCILHLQGTANVKLYVVEVAFGDRPFEVTTSEDVQLRTKDILWHKENAINIAVQRFPVGWKYGAYWDSDFHGTRYDWALEAIHKLQIHPWVQLFTSYAHMSLRHKILQNRPSFAYAYHEYYGGRPKTHAEKISAATGKAINQPSDTNFLPEPTMSSNLLMSPVSSDIIIQMRNANPGATGGAWAFTKEAFSEAGGLLDTCIAGAGDWYMAFGLVGNKTDGHPEALSCGPAYEASIRRWQERAYSFVQGNIGYVDNFCTHQWHGDIKDRGYGDRWKILRDHKFDPLIDVTKDWQGLLTWTGNKPQLEADLRRYFLSRDEDSTECTVPTLI